MTLADNLISVAEARSKFIPRNDDGKPISLATLYRWINKGLLGPDGTRTKLQVVYRGRKPFTTPEAIGAFFDALTESRSVRSDQEVVDATKEQLRRAGLA
ncbi:MAG: hypothetical protein AB8G99_23125 [Planctomycetaceae bacterium]